MGFIKKVRKFFKRKRRTQSHQPESIYDEEECVLIQYCLSKGTSLHIAATYEVCFVNDNDKHKQVVQSNHGEQQTVLSCSSNNKVKPSKTGINYKDWHEREKETDVCQITISPHTSTDVPDEEEVIQKSPASKETSESTGKNVFASEETCSSLSTLYPVLAEEIAQNESPATEEAFPNTSKETYPNQNEASTSMENLKASTAFLTGEQSTPVQEKKKRIRKEKNKQAAKRYRQRKKAKDKENKTNLENSLLKEQESRKNDIVQLKEDIKKLVQTYFEHNFDFGNQKQAMLQIQERREKLLYYIDQIGKDNDETDVAKKYLIPKLDQFIQEKKEEEMKELREIISTWPDMTKVVDESLVAEIMQDDNYREFHRQLNDDGDGYGDDWVILDENDIYK